MDEKFFFDAMRAVGLRTFIFDEDAAFALAKQEEAMAERSAPVRNALYTVRQAPNTFNVIKFSPDFEVLETYQTGAYSCTCPAGHMETCRHRQILEAFYKADRVDTGWFVNWDKAEWFPPVENEE